MEAETFPAETPPEASYDVRSDQLVFLRYVRQPPPIGAAADANAHALVPTPVPTIRFSAPSPALCLPCSQIDEGLSPLEAVLRYSGESSHLLQRISYICSIPAAAAESLSAAPGSAATVAGALLPLLVQLSFDDDPEIKHAAATVIAPLAQVLAQASSSTDDGCGASTSDGSGAAATPASNSEPAGSSMSRGGGSSSDAGSAGGDASHAHSSSGGGGGVGEAMLELLVVSQRLLHDGETLVQEAAEAAVTGLAPLLSPAGRADALASVLASLCDEAQADEELAECGARLLARLVGDAGLAARDPAWCQRVALPRLRSLASHPSYAVRLELAAAVPPLLPALPAWQRAELLLPLFGRLCTDPVWSVRQEAAGEFAAMAAQLSREEAR